jgi:hypothetical protein
VLRAADQKHLESFEMWWGRRMEKISWTSHVRNEEVLLRVNEQRNILHEIRKWKANWIGHIESFGTFYSYLSFPLSTPAFLGFKEPFLIYSLLGEKDDSVK